MVLDGGGAAEFGSDVLSSDVGIGESWERS